MFQDSLHHFQSSVSKVGLYSVKCPNSCSLTRYSSRSLAMLMSQFAARSRMGLQQVLVLAVLPQTASLTSCPVKTQKRLIK